MVRATRKKQAQDAAPPPQDPSSPRFRDVRDPLPAPEWRYLPIDTDPYAIYLMQEGVKKLEAGKAGNLVKKTNVQHRRERIAELWKEAVALHPRSRTKLHDYIIKKLKEEGFDKSKKSGVTIETLTSRDPPYLRKKNKI